MSRFCNPIPSLRQQARWYEEEARAAMRDGDLKGADEQLKLLAAVQDRQFDALVARARRAQ